MAAALLFLGVSLPAPLGAAPASPGIGAEILGFWNFGGEGDECFASVLQTRDGGVFLTGWTDSVGGPLPEARGRGDFWALKLDSKGVGEWERGLGGSGDDLALSAVQAPDGAFVLLGGSDSSDGDLSVSLGEGDMWAVELSPEGALQWSRALGGSDQDMGRSVVNAADGGFVVLGDSYSGDGDLIGRHGESDAFLAKLDASGNVLWKRIYGGAGEDTLRALAATPDGGYAAAGCSDGGEEGGGDGGYDFWFLKLNARGGKEWEKTIPGSGDDCAYSLISASDGSYVLAGSSERLEGGPEKEGGGSRIRILKLDPSGSSLWDRTLKDGGREALRSLVETPDGSLLAVGFARPSGSRDDASEKGGMLVMKLDSMGLPLWRETLGGLGLGLSIAAAGDGAYLAAGCGEGGGGLFQNNGGIDALLLKFKEKGGNF
ncbi:MAG: hypothetical protein LBR53_04080 [Deltaproteobacteria bacterium]|nr:hypothetical protein [Deltaproteobacteria bacterium]